MQGIQFLNASHEKTITLEGEKGDHNLLKTSIKSAYTEIGGKHFDTTNEYAELIVNVPQSPGNHS